MNSTVFEVLESNYRVVSKILDSRALAEKSKFLLYSTAAASENNFYFERRSSQKTNNSTYNEAFSVDKNSFVLQQQQSQITFDPADFPDLGDKSCFYFLENSLQGFRNVFEKLDDNYNSLLDKLISFYRTKLVILFVLISTVVVTFFISEGISFYNNYDRIYMKYFVLFDIIRNFIDEIYLKLELLEELFQDFTDSNKQKYLRLTEDTEFMEKKLTKAETLKDSYNEIKNKIMLISESKTSTRIRLVQASAKATRLLDYYDNKAEKQKVLGIFGAVKPKGSVNVFANMSQRIKMKKENERLLGNQKNLINNVNDNKNNNNLRNLNNNFSNNKSNNNMLSSKDPSIINPNANSMLFINSSMQMDFNVNDNEKDCKETSNDNPSVNNSGNKNNNNNNIKAISGTFHKKF